VGVSVKRVLVLGAQSAPMSFDDPEYTASNPALEMSG
jgi:GDP-D-mannose dehydratase